MRDKQAGEEVEVLEEEQIPTSSKGDGGWLLVHVSGVASACDFVEAP